MGHCERKRAFHSVTRRTRVSGHQLTEPSHLNMDKICNRLDVVVLVDVVIGFAAYTCMSSAPLMTSVAGRIGKRVTNNPISIGLKATATTTLHYTIQCTERNRAVLWKCTLTYIGKKAEAQYFRQRGWQASELYANQYSMPHSITLIRICVSVARAFTVHSVSPSLIHSLTFKTLCACFGLCVARATATTTVMTSITTTIQ